MPFKMWSNVDQFVQRCVDTSSVEQNGRLAFVQDFSNEIFWIKNAYIISDFNGICSKASTLFM